MSKEVFITGGTGYLGKRLIARLLQNGYEVSALVRSGSEKKLPKGCKCITADPFNPDSFFTYIKPGSTFVQLLGVSHPGPSKKALFYSVDSASARASVLAASKSGCNHFVYVSVAQTPTRIMKDYQQCRAGCEELIMASNIRATILRPWYVIGPGHYWPLLLFPFFKLLEVLPSTARIARALQFVYLSGMLAALMSAIESPPAQKVRIVEIAEINRPSLVPLRS